MTNENINIKVNESKINDSIRKKAENMLKTNGVIEPINLITDDLFDLNLLSVYDNNNNLIDYDTKDAVLGKDYWDKKENEYIDSLKGKLKQDISKVDKQGLKDLIVDNNKEFLKTYITGIKNNALDLGDENTRYGYANRLTKALIDLQQQEINKINIIDFLKLDLKTRKRPFMYYVNVSYIINVQCVLENYFIKNKINDNFDKDIINRIISNTLHTDILKDQLKRVDRIYKESKKQYDDRHKKRLEIDNLLKNIVNKYKEHQDYLDSKIDTLLIENDTENDAKIVIHKTNTKIPTFYSMEFPIMNLFNNVYPIEKYKSTDDNRHKDIDIKAKLILNLNDKNNDDPTIQMENLRLINFVENGNITLFPIQGALINSFITLRDLNASTDEFIPFLSVIKYITQNKLLREPKSKKDRALYEDFMLFFKRCKIQVKMVNRKTTEIIFETKKPIPLLENTPVIKNDRFGYIVGNSIINILKGVLEELTDKPYKLTTQTSKGYLKTKLPPTPPTMNLVQFIFPKIAQMINSYKTKGKYQGTINITKLYDFQALYNQRTKPTKDDRDKVRNMLNNYLDELKNKKVIDSYKALDDKKTITQYKIIINKDANL